MNEHEKGVFLKSNLLCPRCDHHSMAQYTDGFFCFHINCNEIIPEEEVDINNLISNNNKGAKKVVRMEPNNDRLIFTALTKRKIKKDTCEKYGVTVDPNNGDYHLPYFSKEGEAVAIKIRGQDKIFKWGGTPTKATALFGQQLFGTGRYITITEGELDALAAYEMLGSKFPVVSIRDGAPSALRSIKSNLDFLDNFEHIVICFDNDEAGRLASNKVAEILPPKKVRIVSLALKDANEYLIKGAGKDFIDKWWSAKPYTPEGIVEGSSLWELITEEDTTPCVPYPWEDLNTLTYGMRQGELITISAGTGLGKSSFIKELVYHLLQDTEDNIGLLFMEQNIKKTGLDMLSLEVNRPLHLPGVEVDDGTMRSAFDSTLGTGRLFLYDSWGSADISTIVSVIRNLANGSDCKWIFLDHISIIVSDQRNNDERRALDEIMTKLAMLTQETGVGLILVSHLRRPSSQGHEDGAVTSLAQLRGTAAIGQLSDMVIGLERNGQADDMVIRHTTTVRVLKNRFAGLTGVGCQLFYDLNTGRLTEGKI